MLIEIHTFSFKEMHLKTSSVKWRPFCLSVTDVSLDGHKPRISSVYASVKYMHESFPDFY